MEKFFRFAYSLGSPICMAQTFETPKNLKKHGDNAFARTGAYLCISGLFAHVGYPFKWLEWGDLPSDHPLLLRNKDDFIVEDWRALLA